MGKRVTDESSEKKGDHPQEKDVRSTNSDDGITETSVNCSSVADEKSTVLGTVTTPPQPTMAEDAEEYIKPIIKDGEVILEVECGQNKALLYLSKLCQGSKGPCIYFQGSWLAPNEFQFVSGRETAKDWKRSIRHHGKSLKLLLAKGILSVHPTVCDCEGCRTGSTLNRNRNGTKKKTPANKESKPKITTDGVKPISQDGSKPIAPLSTSEGEKTKKEAKKIKKPLEKPVSPLRESKSTNIMNPAVLPTVPITQERLPKVPIVMPCNIVPGVFPVPKVPVLSPVKPEPRDPVSKVIEPTVSEPNQRHNETAVKSEIIPMVQPTPVKLSAENCKAEETAKQPSSTPVIKSTPDVCKENYIKDDKPPKDTNIKERPKEMPKETKHPKIENPKTSSFESPKPRESSRSSPEDHARKLPEREHEKMTPKSFTGLGPRLGSEVPTFRLPETFPDTAAYADYMRMLTGGHPLFPQVPQQLDTMYSLRTSDPSFNHVLHPYHGCAMYNPVPPHPGLYQKDPVLYPTTAGALPSSIGAPCFSPLHMFSQRLPYALSAPVMELPRPFQYMPIPTSMSYPCSSINGLKRHHAELDSSSDIANKRLRLDYQVPDFRFDSYPSCSTTYPPLYYDSALLQSEDYRRKRLEESMNSAKDIPGYLHPYMGKPSYQCTCVNRPDDIRSWSVEDVCSFVSRLDGCTLYAETFREQRVDGKILPLLTTDHMMKSLGLKLGPAVLIAEAVAKKLQESRLNGCDSCRKLTLGGPIEM
ncbi:uncharacterized protein LOC126812590 [Patella vulgata]|uniref:uncharacterized protein LOC126812590 n=1 Tax=Patella vulgata TaxID=6465 RepID=UPI00217F9F31|nr:uncharacterized protein LOC126812590 [Patella vulgata]